MALPVVVIPALVTAAGATVKVIGDCVTEVMKSNNETKVEKYKTLGKTGVALAATGVVYKLVSEALREDTKDINAEFKCDRNGASVQFATTSEEESYKKL